MFNLVYGLGGQELIVIAILLIPWYFIAKMLFSSNVKTDAKLLWVILVLLFSYIGFIFYLFSDTYKDVKRV